ncbi:hypothetical protein Trydic_g6316 [Trypoxylus dichotomus]
MMLLFPLYILLTLPAVYALESKEKPIEGAPYIVSLIYEGKHYCSGSYIHINWVITAGHCIVLKLVKQTEIRMGSDTWDTGGELRQIKKVIQHPLKAPIKPGATDSDATVEALNNIGLIKLKTPFTKGRNIDTIEMVLKKDKYKGKNMEVLGYGKLCKEDTESKNLNSFTFAVVKDDNYVIVPPWNLEAKSEVDCKGDSGGPIVADGQLIGLVVCGNHCGTKQKVMTTTFLKLSPHSKWIKTKMDANDQRCVVINKLLQVISFLIISSFYCQ